MMGSILPEKLIPKPPFSARKLSTFDEGAA